MSGVAVKYGEWRVELMADGMKWDRYPGRVLFCVVRNPFDRIVSEYRYYHHVLHRTDAAPCTPSDLNTFINERVPSTSRIQPLTHSLSQSVTQSLTHSLIHSPTHPLPIAHRLRVQLTVRRGPQKSALYPSVWPHLPPDRKVTDHLIRIDALTH